MNIKPRVGFIVGPTAAGKSSAALRIAEQLGAEIVNADSRQVYRGMDIGTAKPRAAELLRVPHHLIDIRDPGTPMDVAEFASLARRTIVEIAARKRPVLVVGGSGLYVRVIRSGICAIPPASSSVRALLTAVAAQRGTTCLFERLCTVDSEAAARISRNDLKRIVRALEVHELTGVPLSEHQRRHRFAERPFETLTVALTQPRERLYKTIDRRFAAMLEEGLVGEVQRLWAKGYDRMQPPASAAMDESYKPVALPLTTIGYREIAQFLRGEFSLAEATARAQRASRRLAKRQLTWFRADPEVIWLDAERDVDAALKLFRTFFGEADLHVSGPTA